MKELKAIFNRNDIPSIPIAMINSRINEYTNRQNTKEYLGSWLHQRRCIDKKLDEGFHVVVNDEEEDDQLNFLRNVANANIGKGNNFQSTEEMVEAELNLIKSGEPDILSRVPSQKLSVLIHRKNAAIKKEKRRREKELLKSQMDSQEMENEEDQMLEIMRLENGN